MLRNRQGQNLAEYAVLVGLVVGTAVAMQFFVRARLQASTMKRADEFVTAYQKIQDGFTLSLGKGDKGRKTESVSATDVDMETSTKGDVEIDSTSTTISNLAGAL